jgi:hypothetical protein
VKLIKNAQSGEKLISSLSDYDHMKNKRLITLVISIFVILIITIGVFGFGLYLRNRFFNKQEALKKPLDNSNSTKVLFLHHSTGGNIWKGGIPEWFSNYNDVNNRVDIVEQDFPKRDPYGWNNYPYDYWNIWVNHAGEKPYKNEPTLEMISKTYDIVIMKHCFPVSKIKANTGEPRIDSDEKTVENYKLQYISLKEKMNSFPNIKFIVWTGAALVEEDTNPESADRARTFFDWVKDDWDIDNDNIYIWDFHELQTEGGLYFKEEYAKNPTNSHPNDEFSSRVAPLLCERIVEVLND